MGDSNLLFESVFKRKLSAAGTRDYLTQITTEYPYFSPAQFYLLLLSETGTLEYEKQAAKTTVLFNNAWWLQFQLQENRQGIAETGVKINEADQQIILTESKESIVIHPIQLNESISNKEMGGFSQPAIKAVYTEQELPPVIENNDFLPGENNIQPVDEGNWNAPPLADSNISKVEIEFLPDENNIQPAIEENWNAPPFDENIISPVEIEFLPPENSLLPEIEDNRNDRPFADSSFSPLETTWEAPITPIEMKTVFNEPVGLQEPETAFVSRQVPDEIPVSKVVENEAKIIDNLHLGHFNTDSIPLVNEPETDESPINEVEIAPLNFKLNIDTAATIEDTITFEPLHTTDYFASLGIKLSSEIPPSDKLGKQLKSFTEWLKTMKKVHPDQLPPQSVASAISIQNLAEQSNKEGEVVTEAMADVLLQQGKADKAIEVYKKLSLLNPSKSAYFAAKIDQLKEH